MDKFDYKVLASRRAGVLKGAWFDGDEELAPEIDSKLLTRYGEDGWELVATMQLDPGTTHKLILKRRRG
ncbi:MAG: DUF4177 domain-containing protein [Limisphaerales bacterium]